MVYDEYKELVGNAASVCTIGQMFSGILVCKDIIKRGSTKNVSVIPFLGGLAMGALMMVFAVILDDQPMIRVNVVGIVLSLAYLICYYYYSDNRSQVRFQMMQASGFVMLMLGYIRWEDPELIEFRYGIIITILIMMLIAAPLFSLGEIIRTKSSETLPFPMIASGTVVTLLWLLYGIILENTFIQLQNAVGLALQAIQLSLFVIYPSKPSFKAGEKKKKKN